MKRRLNVWKTPLLGNREQGFCGNRHELPGHCMAGKRKHNSWTLSAPSGGGGYILHAEDFGAKTPVTTASPTERRLGTIECNSFPTGWPDFFRYFSGIDWRKGNKEFAFVTAKCYLRHWNRSSVSNALRSLYVASEMHHVSTNMSPLYTTWSMLVAGYVHIENEPNAWLSRGSCSEPFTGNTCRCRWRGNIWRGKSCRFNPRESGPAVTQGQVEWLRLRPSLAPQCGEEPAELSEIAVESHEVFWAQGRCPREPPKKDVYENECWRANTSRSGEYVSLLSSEWTDAISCLEEIVSACDRWGT